MKELEESLKKIPSETIGYAEAKELISELSQPMNLKKLLDTIIKSLIVASKSFDWLDFHKSVIEILNNKTILPEEEKDEKPTKKV